MLKIIICTLKSWNIEYARQLSHERSLIGDRVWIITNKADLRNEILNDIQPDYIFFPHWSYIISDDIYNNFECIVFHMTDLPYGRGGSPLQNLIVRGHKNTKISALRVEKELDAGPIYLKHDLSLDGSAEKIYKRASKIVFTEMIPEILESKTVPIPQQGEAVVFPRRKKEQSDLKDCSSLQEFYDYIRMLDAEGYPHAFIQFGNIRIEFEDAKFKDGILMATAKFYEENNEQ